MSITRKRLVRWVAFIICALMVPLIAMQFTSEVNWKLSDFVIAGVVLLGIGIVYEMIIQRSKNIVYRVAFGLGILGIILLFWVNGAVGIIGNESQDVNLLYIAALVIGLAGTLVSRFKPKGMSITFYIIALVQILVPLAALIIWPPGTISWSPGVLGVFLLSASFALVFFISGMLFRRAAVIETFA